jgi:hypothetical protein
MRERFIFYFSLAIMLGVGIAWIGSNPGWDFTVMTSVQLTLAAALCGYLAKHKPWLIALAAGIWFPMLSILIAQNYESLLAFLPSFTGAYAGYGLRMALRKLP